MKTFIAAILLLCIYVLAFGEVKAGTFNPCEYMNMNASKINMIDVGTDPNFERIKQQNNQELVRACQEYQIKLMQQMKNDLNRDNY